MRWKVVLQLSVVGSGPTMSFRFWWNVSLWVFLHYVLSWALCREKWHWECKTYGRHDICQKILRDRSFVFVFVFVLYLYLCSNGSSLCVCVCVCAVFVFVLLCILIMCFYLSLCCICICALMHPHYVFVQRICIKCSPTTIWLPTTQMHKQTKAQTNKCTHNEKVFRKSLKSFEDA